MLRGYQKKTTQEIDAEFANGATSVLATTATGGGKSRMTSYMAKKRSGHTVIQAHRQELVHQLAMALAGDGIEHRVLAAPEVTRFLIEKQTTEFGRSFVYSGAQHTVASVDMLLARAEDLAKWCRTVDFVQTDEAHHVVGAMTGIDANKWGKARRLFGNARFLGWTATAMRPDRKPLRSSFERLVIGPSTRELLELGFLTPYQIFGPPPSIDMAGALVGESGDFSNAELKRRAARSTITGDMLTHYQKLAPGRVGIGFCVSVEQAKEAAERFNGAGIRSEWMSSKETDDRKRVRTMEALQRGDIKLIFNVDLLGEGVDVPRVEVVLDGRPTMSLVRYLQVFGRLLRLFPGKEFGIYIDMVGNVMRHGFPDRGHVWSLDEPERRKRQANDEDEITACTKCFKHYEAYRSKCPHCGHKPAPKPRGPNAGPEAVDGDLTEYSDEMLKRLLGQAAHIMEAAPRGKVPAYVERNWNERATAQTQLRDGMDWWMSWQTQKCGLDESSAYRLFWRRFKVDFATAQTLGGAQVTDLHERIWKDINA